MGSLPRTENSAPEIWALGALPPPVTGMTLVTEKVVNRLREKTPVTVVTWSAGDARQRFYMRIVRLFRAVRALARLLIHGRVQNARVYVTANSKGGLLMTGLIVNAARRLGYTVYLHHHAYNYIDAFDTKMAWIVRNMEPNGVHIVHCPQMVDDFRARYPDSSHFEILYPSIVSLPVEPPRTHMGDPFCLGFLANLTIEKGLDLAIETFRVLEERGRTVRLVLAGPCNSAEAEQMLNAALKKFEGRITHLGAVYGDRKVAFFKSIDCFLFPTKFDCESWGIVLNEALAAGVPVITTNRGSIRTLVGTKAGLIVDDADQYVDAAVNQVEAWIDAPESYIAISKAAVEQAEFLHREAANQLETVVSNICSHAASTLAQTAKVAV